MITIPFKIGEQYEKWESELEIARNQIPGYDSYNLSKEFKYSDSIPQVELTFEMDICMSSKESVLFLRECF